jgi:predicted metal-dependent phosphoesterase TrpH
VTSASLPAGGGAALALVDLHMHSTASDGAFAPAAVVEAAKAAGLGAIALTDHDTLGGVAEARQAGDRLGVRVVPGVELSAVEGDREVHVLGLHLSRLDELERQLVIFRTARRTRAERIVETLNRLGVPITLDAVLVEAAGGAIGRPHVARVLVANGWVMDFREAFDRYLGAGRPAFVAKHRVSVADAIALIHCAGGLAVLAHPGSEGNRRWIEALVAVGLDGIEVRHPGHSPDDVAQLGALVEHFGLVPSGGSDWHGAPEGARAIGCMKVPAEWLARQEARVRERASRERVA